MTLEMSIFNIYVCLFQLYVPAINGQTIMKSRLTSILLAFCVLATISYGKAPEGVPEPASLPPADIWQLDVEFHGNPQQLEVTLPGDEKPTRFWYLVYTITNNTGQDVDFYPTFEVMTNTFKLYEAGKVPTKPVYDAVEVLYKKSVPLLEPEIQVAGKILQGEDNARDCVCILDDFDPNATSVKLFVSGFSNETVTKEIADDKNEKKSKKVLLRKTLMLEYSVPGDERNQDNKVMLFRRKEWIMR